jgi:iterative type I PKS product template protein
MGGPAIRVERQHPINTTSCQRVIYEALDEKALTGTVIVQSDLTHPKLYPVVTGHVVNERVLTPGVIYAEIAMTVADYLWRTLVPESGPIGLNVCEFDVHKPLMVDVPPARDGQYIQVECNANINEGAMEIHVRSVTWDGDLLQEHGRGLLRFDDPSTWAADWSRQQFLVRGQIEQLRAKLDNGEAHQIFTGMAYKLFEQLVTYAPIYQGMREIILDKDDTAAFAKVKLQYTPGLDGEFFLSPYAIDNLCHLSGFIVNAADVVNDEPLVFISHGWESLKFLAPEKITPTKEYTTFVRMVLGEKNISSGDVYVFDDETDAIIAVLYGLKFQGIPQRLMDVLLPPKKKVKFDITASKETKSKSKTVATVR